MSLLGICNCAGACGQGTGSGVGTASAGVARDSSRSCETRDESRCEKRDGISFVTSCGGRFHRIRASDYQDCCYLNQTSILRVCRAVFLPFLGQFAYLSEEIVPGAAVIFSLVSRVITRIGGMRCCGFSTTKHGVAWMFVGVIHMGFLVLCLHEVCSGVLKAATYPRSSACGYSRSDFHTTIL